jgi:DNA-binding transcriptional regulator LsrR (DeoR family)
MPRVNIYLPNDIYELTSRWRSGANLSEICARAIRDEFEAADVHRAPLKFRDAVAPPSEIERALAIKYGLAECIVVEPPENPTHAREQLGLAAAEYLDRTVCDGSIIGIAGGRQTWCLVRALRPRRVRATITALGVGSADPKLLHAHPNTLATLLWLAYSPRSEAHVVGASTAANLWKSALPARDYTSYFVFASCSRFDPSSPFASVLGEKAVTSLAHQGAFADFAYNFMDAHGQPIDPPVDNPHTLVSAATLQRLAQRRDARVVLIAGGVEKVSAMRLTLTSQLCNMVITDRTTADNILE